mmetsp:Transcript_22339/g.39854  ORF Transcript_22339/g.39854 Transcript_22339/m.39854 type:complete len:216 (+) Transcript_22339:597-1244(+)
MDVAADDALCGHAARLLGGRGNALLAQKLLRGVDVTVTLRQCLLAVHHPRARLVAQLLHQLRRHRHLGRRLLLLLRSRRLLLRRLLLRFSHSLPHGGYLLRKVVRLLLDALAQLVPLKPTDHHVLTRGGDGLLEQLLHALVRVLDEGLVQQRHGLRRLLQPPLDDLLADVLRLGQDVLLPHLDLLLLGHQRRINVVHRHHAHLGARRDLHRDVGR